MNDPSTGDAVFALGDDLGPAQVIHLADAAHGLRAIVVVDNVACGPAIGGARMALDVSLRECARLARAMTLKNAMAGLPHGGGKSVIFADPRMPSVEKERLVRAFARAIRDVRDYIAGPDMGTDETCMAWVHDEIGRAVGLPREVGGIPLDEIGATGFGVAACADVAREFCDLDLRGARVAVQGFGAVGRHAARFLGERGAILVAASDSKATVIDPSGIDIAALSALKVEGRSVLDYPRGQQADVDAIIDVDCDVWIPAARPDVVRADNVDRLRARLVIEGANIPLSAEAEAALHRRGVLVVPDFIANAGGVICASVEYHGGTEREALERIDERIRTNTRAVLVAAQRDGVMPRAAAEALAEIRVRAAMAFRR